jgi:hypothetical protein
MSGTAMDDFVRWVHETTGQSLDPVEPFEGPGYHVSTRVPAEVGALLEQEARRRGQTVPEFVGELIEAALPGSEVASDPAPTASPESLAG